jgi:hypothetical protein
MKDTIFWDIKPYTAEEHFASVFWIENYAKHETSVKALLTTCFHAGFCSG